MARKRKSRKRRKSPRRKIVYRTKYKTRYRTRKRRNPARRRRPAARQALGKLQTLIPATVAVGVGLLGIRTAVQKFFPTQTGYVRALIMAGGGLVIGEVGKMVLKGKNRKFIAYLQMGGLLAAVLETFEMVTGGAYSQYYTLGDYGAPQTKRYFLPAAGPISAGMGDFTDRGAASSWSNTPTW